MTTDTDSEIVGINLRKILDSRGNPTVEAEVETSNAVGTAAAPSGASTGEYEAVELPVEDAIEEAHDAINELIGVEATRQRKVDSILRYVDGTDNFSGIGANAAVAISLAAAKAGAASIGVPTFHHVGGALNEEPPVPLGNVVGGGEHAQEATDIQEFLVAPTGAPTFADAAFTNAEIHTKIGEILEERGNPAGKGDEGAWAPQIDDAEAFEIVDEAVENVNADFELRLGLDMAASEIWDADAGVYEYSDTERTPEEQIEYVESLVRNHDLIYVEDPLEEDDFEGFAELTSRLEDTDVQICGDDLFVTNVERLERGIDAGAANSILIKPNQIGTVSATKDAIETARRNAYSTVMSHRSGETEDATIAHLAVGFGTRFIKTGAVGGERTAKLNELIRIQDSISD
ncbi:MAG: phosphopyruvate hydratase [Halobacteria archaeon]|nr:phosphopyruvate hydratase [Halobacteria archaeon]